MSFLRISAEFLWIALVGGGLVLAAEEPVSVTLTVPADLAWTDTGLDMRPGARFRIEAWGRAAMVGLRLWEQVTGRPLDRDVGPEGTYVLPRHAQGSGAGFPLPAMAEGPAPAWCLIGRIGEAGRPFYVGARYDGTTSDAGRLWLGINDDHPEGNAGRFDVRITVDPPPATALQERPVVMPGSRRGRPVRGARVLLLYIDGLRPDVLREMAEGGFLPHMKQVFLDRGLEVRDAFTVFPSNTLIANGSLFTGLFSDSTGVKSQNQFERTTLKPKGQLSEWLPDALLPKPKTRVLNLLDKYAPENTHAFLLQRRVPTLASRLGKAYRFTTLPIAPLNPPPQWMHRAINTLGPFGLSARLSMRLDAVNAQYTVEDLLGDPDARVITVWFPMVDKTSHHSARGQFGAARRELALADRLFGRILDRLREVGWDRSTYLLLVSDHGHVGGNGFLNRACNLPRDWAHRQLGCNAKVVGQEWMHPGIDPGRFVFFDNQGAGQAKVFLPHGAYFDGAWRWNRLYELTHYQLRPNRPPVDLLESLRQFRPPGWDGRGPSPVDLILVKLDEQRTLVSRSPDCQALIHRERDDAGGEQYRYEPVRRLSQSPDGALQHDPPLPGQDPLGYLQDPAVMAAVGGPGWFAMAHPARDWLLATAHSRYPDAVVAMAKFFAWQPRVADLAPLRDPDVVVTASEGWSFRSDDGQGTDHGYPLAESMRITLFLAGPNLPHGVLTEPQRIVDVLPTILEMVGHPYDPHELDGRAISGIYEW